MSDDNPWRIQSSAGSWGRYSRPTGGKFREICGHCLDLDHRNYREGLQNQYGTDTRWFWFKSTIDLLMQMEKGGCRFCSVLLEALMLYRRVWEDIPSTILEIFVNMLNTRPRLELRFSPTKWTLAKIDVLSLEIFTETGQLTPFPWSVYLMP
jgi:hypothetical protein